VNPQSSAPPSPTIKRRPETNGRSSASSASSPAASNDAGSFAPGSHVKHAKYGRGLVLRREGTGDAAKLTVSFPGFGQKKLIEKYAGLEKA
jgi:DNA helicase-2/ATP-dependent DNA helicase PcrA